MQREPASLLNPWALPACRTRTCCVAWAVLLGCSGAAWADTWQVQPAVQLNAVASNNVRYAAPGSETSDLVTTVSPQLQLAGKGGGYRVLGMVGLDGVAYARRTIADRLLPRANLNLNAALVDRLLFLDGELYAGTSAANAFGVLGEGNTTFNRGITTRERLSPYLQRDLSPNTSVLARSDNSWVQTELANAGLQRFNSYVQSDVVRFDLRPQPLGLRVEATRLDSRNPGSRLGANTTFDVARVSLFYAPVPELRLGVDGGRDKAKYGTTEQSGSLKGASIRWTPTERTVLDTLVEKRFFGTGWNGTFTHRTPFMAITATATRQATTYSALLASLQPGASNSVSELLGAALTTQFPDPVQRQTEVNNLIAKYNLPGTLTSALDLYSNTAQLERRLNLAVALLGTRHTVTLSVFRQEGQDLLGPNDIPTTALNSANSRQLGGSLNVTRRLTPETTADLSLTAVHIAGYGPRAGQVTENKIARFGATHNLSPRTSVTGGARRQLVDSQGGFTPSAQVTSVYVGALHRF